jgi:hypothetical protein
VGARDGGDVSEEGDAEEEVGRASGSVIISEGRCARRSK